MPQVLKDEVRARILDAALEVFAADGVTHTTMAAIAARAGLGTASLYRYYASKDELFAAIVPPALTRRFEQLVEERVAALARASVGDPATGALGGELLALWRAHRLAVVILLDRAEGTAYARFGERFVELLVKASLAALRAAHPGLRISPRARFVLTQIFDNTRRLLANVLAHHADPDDLREAIEAFWSYQIAGLHGFRAHLTRS